MEGKLKFKSLEDLQSQAKTGDISKFKLKNLCESSSKVWLKAMAEDVRLDEETSYILYWKYVLLCKSICQQADYKSDIKYYEGMYNIKKNMKTAVKRLETLSTSLDLKYEKLSNAETERRLTDENEELAKTKITDDKRKKNKENIANGELKLNIMSVKELDSLIKQKSTSFFILDTRPEQDYHKGHINHPSSLSVPQEILSRGVTAHAIGRNIRIQERTQWERRATVDKLIICDWNSKEFIPGSPAFTLLTALTDWDRENTYRCAPVLLEGGYEKFRLAHPLQVTDPTFKMPVLQEVDRNKNILRLEDIIFPDLDSLDQGFIETPSPSPKMVPNFEPKSSRVQYPSLDGYTPSTVYSNPSTSTPLIPDRRTKPARSNGQDLDESSSSNAPRDDFNAARLSGISRMDSGASLNSTVSASSLNKAILGSTNGTDFSSSTFSRGRNSSTLGTNLTDSDDFSVQSFKPKVDRSLKQVAEAVYSRVKPGLDMAGLLEVEGELAELSVSRTKDNLEKELEWTKLCKTREDASNEEMKAALNQQAERLFEEIEELTAKNLEKDKREMELVQEIDKLRLRLKKESEKEMIGEARRLEERRKEEENRRRMRYKEEEAAKLKREVEEKRRIRKKAAAEQRRRDEEKGMEEERRRDEARNRRRQEEKEYREKLKDEGSSSNSGMRRSYSSPNIARMLERGPNEDESPGISTPKFPKFDRAQKPSDIVKRDFAGVWGTTTKPGLTGLRNLGNTCYMNSILQCVSHTLPLSQYFESGRYQEDVNKYSETRGLVAYEFAALMQSLWSNQFKFISPADIKEAVGRIKVEFAGRDQQDSHEFVCKLLEWLHEDTNRVQRPSKMPEIDNTTIPEAEACRKFWKAFLDRNQSIIVQLFYGLTKQTTQCLNCRAKSIKFQEFYNLNLFIPNGNSKSSLRDCLARFVQENRIDYTCEKCRKSDGAVQKMDIVKLPPFLIIHLERFYPDEEIFRSGEQKYRKKQNFVNFQLSDLNLGDFVSGTENSYSNFNLYAVSNHFGSLEGGHYTAVCYSKHMKRWYKYDDQDVTSISEGSVQSSAAYILFYSATNASNSLLPLG